ncbi:MAG: hypothetical protein ACKOQY_05075 [Bacteroidota bacterium]
MNALNELRSRKALAKRQVEEREQTLKSRFNHLEQHFGKMALNSMLPMPASQFDKFSGFFDGMNKVMLNWLPSSVSEEKRERMSSNIKSAELLLAGLAYRYVKKFIGG